MVTSRQEAIEKIVTELKGSGYGQILIVSPDHWSSVVLQEDTQAALASTLADYRRAEGSLTIGLRSALFVAGSKPERVVGFGRLRLLVIDRWAFLPTSVSRALEGYAGVPLVAFS